MNTEKLKRQTALAYLKGHKNGDMSAYMNGVANKPGSKISGSHKARKVRGKKK